VAVKTTAAQLSYPGLFPNKKTVCDRPL